MSKETRIELTKDVAKQLVDMKHKRKYMEETPFEEFTLVVPIEVYLTKEKLISDIQGERGSRLEPIKDNQTIKFI